MVSSEERRALEEIKGRRRVAKLAMLGFVGVGLIGGIPVHDRPLVALPTALLPLLLASGFLWSLSIWSFTRSFARACPRCGVGAGEEPRGIWFALTHRTFWGSKCVSCGLSFKELDPVGN